MRDGFAQAGQHRDAVCDPVQQHARVRPGVTAVDDVEDVVPLGVPDEAVGGLAVLLTELALAVDDCRHALGEGSGRSEEHTSELQSLMRISYAVFCLKKN